MHRFKLLDRIGNGGYSQVFRTLDQQTGQMCALKVMKQPYQKFGTIQDLQLATLKKFTGRPGIIQLVDSFIEDGFLIIVFELLQRTLIDFYRWVRTEQCRGLRASEIKSILLQIALAVDTMHSQGYAHRDIKPQNILVDRQGQIGQLTAKLVDFGLAKKIQDERNTEYIATRWYRAPQLLLSMAYRLSVDMFALGCLMAELYNGREVFRGLNNIGQLSQICTWLGPPTQDTWPQGEKHIKSMGVTLPGGIPKSLRMLAPGISDSGLDLLSKLLVLNPDKRVTVRDMLQHPYFDSIRHELPAPVLKHLIARQISVQNLQKKPVEDGQVGYTTCKKQYSQPKLLLAEPIFNLIDSVGSKSTINPNRPVSFYYPTSAVHRENRKALQAGVQQRLSITIRSKTPSEWQQPTLVGGRQVVDTSLNIARETVKQEVNFVERTLAENDNSFIRSKLKIAQAASTYQSSSATVSQIAANLQRKQYRPRSNITRQQPAPKLLHRDISPNDHLNTMPKKLHSIERPLKPFPFKNDSPNTPSGVQQRFRHMISTDRLTVKKPPSLQKLFEDPNSSSHQHKNLPLSINNSSGGGSRSLKETISSKTRSKVNSILLNYKNLK